MTQIDELLRHTANAGERDDDAERRAIGRAQRALSAAINAAATQDPLPRGSFVKGFVTNFLLSPAEYRG